MNLSEWHTRLSEHFSTLRVDRSSVSFLRPIFALEHGLSEPERSELAEAIRAHVAHEAPSSEHALPWVVYAAEIGYRFSGDEYWETFGAETPGWTVHGDRTWIRERYRWFQKEYKAAAPSGRWAEWFTIICWPITHAVLPRDLQGQLARILWEIRHLYTPELLDNPTELGEFIAAHSWNASSRFRNFAQDFQLVGQIASALLLQGKLGREHLIYPSTLHRISDDLDRSRRRREWLRVARGFAEERARVLALCFSRSPQPEIVLHREDARAQITALGIEPRVVLRPTDLARRCWETLLEIPDLSPLLTRFPSMRETLTDSRCVVVGSVGRPLARGRFLYGTSRVQLARWPRPEEVLLRFEQTDPKLEYLLRTECLLRPGPSRLFRIASDGLAYESRSLRVRAGQQYILVSTDQPIAPSEYLDSVDLHCEGIDGVLLRLPSALTSEWAETLRNLGLSQAKTISVWPAGLSPVVWDGEGHGEWLESERPVLAVRSDHDVHSLSFSLTGSANEILELTSITPGEPVFVELPPLPVGLHTVLLRARSESRSDSFDDFAVLLRMRENRAGGVGLNPHGPLFVQLDPVAPTLEQVWDGQVNVEAHGPAGRVLRCAVSLFDKRDGEPTVNQSLPSLPFPVYSAQWGVAFERHFRSQKRVQLAYDAAGLCRLEFTAEELGEISVECEREFVPLRWALRQHREGPVMRLIDDSGDGGQPEVVLFTFEKPALGIQLTPASEYVVSPPGGLYVARQRDFIASAIGLPRIRSLAELGTVVHIDSVRRSPQAILGLADLGLRWGSAKSSGDILSLIRQREVLQAIVHQILYLIGGERWAAAEKNCIGSTDSALVALAQAVTKQDDVMNVGATLAAEARELIESSLDTRVSYLASLVAKLRLMTLTTGAGPDNLSWLSEFALRIASDPRRVHAWAGPNLMPGIKRLLELPTVARSARFLVIAIDRHRRSQRAPGELYASWGWA